jgi:tripartite-type tricarboxylate transporter receptor subunit TctC
MQPRNCAQGTLMRINRRQLLNAFAGLALATKAGAQTRAPMRIVVAFPPGGPIDFVARVLADQLRIELGHNVIVENRPGANGTIGAVEVKRSTPDGNTLWLKSVGSAAVNPSLHPNLPYDVASDFASVSLISNNAELLVCHPSIPVEDAAGFVAWAKAQQKPVTMASTGNGSIPHLALEQFRDASGVDVTHIVYKGGAPAIADLIGNHVNAAFLDVAAIKAQVKAGKVRALGMASKNRHRDFPSVRTLEEQGISGVDTNNWYALYAPAATPKDTIETLNAAVRRALSAPIVRGKLEDLGTEPQASTPKELEILTRQDTEKWARLIRAKNIKAS